MAVMDPLPYLFVCLAAYIAATLGLHSIRKKSGAHKKAYWGALAASVALVMALCASFWITCRNHDLLNENSLPDWELVMKYAVSSAPEQGEGSRQTPPPASASTPTDLTIPGSTPTDLIVSNSSPTDLTK
jgi:hypothetical protein